MNFYRDANGQLLSFEYKGKIYDYVYNQRGDIVAITNELAEIIARYTYDEWGNLLKIDAPTPLGAEVANANPFRYVGKFGVQYDNNTKLYFMGWRDYDAKIGRFLVADEYEGEDTNPISFNRYLYAESDPVNNIDPDGHAPKWLKKITKGVKKAAKATYNFAIGDDIKTLKSKKTKWYQKAGAAISIASNFIPGSGVVSKAAKAAIKGTSKAIKAAKASKAVTQATKVVKATAKKVSSVVNIKPKTVPAPSIKSAPPIQSSAPAKVSVSTPKAKSKVASSGQPVRGNTSTRIEENASKGTEKIQTGGKSDIFDMDQYLKNIDKAEGMYDEFRKSTTDVTSIAKNTGMKESRIQRIKDHLFIKEHIKDHGVGRFDADYDIAQAWKRLQIGTHNQNDIYLLNHELFESRFEGIFKTNYRTAHDKTIESGRLWNP
ncbi:RHS repeat-associated core domain-containing protein [Neobacillus drentensis]